MSAIKLSPTVTVNGITWYLFSVDFDTADGAFSTYLYAIDHGHAALRLEELKESARIVGQITSINK